MNKKALGLIELPNCADAVEALDVMLKTADVEFLTWEKKLGGRLVTIFLQGAVSAVTEISLPAWRCREGRRSLPV